MIGAHPAGKEDIEWIVQYLLDIAPNITRAFDREQLNNLGIATLFVCLVSDVPEVRQAIQKGGLVAALNAALVLEGEWR